MAELKERRRARRRSFPFVRSAVLEVGGRNHIVTVLDLSLEGAFVRTRVSVTPGQELRLKMVLPRDGREVVLPCRLARRADTGMGRPAGLAVRFEGLPAEAVRRIEEFAMEGFRPALQPAPHEHVEYRIVERPDLDAEELNRLGLDGWVLAAALPSPKGVRLVLMRRL